MTMYMVDLEVLDQRKARAGLTDSQLAAQAGVHPGTIWNIRRGRPCSARTLRRIVAALESAPQLPPEALELVRQPAGRAQ